jgi:spermidine synthase
MTDTAVHRETPRAVLLYLILTAVLCGGLVMVIEVLGSRIVGPFFGVSLFVWTSLITVTLVALALGYAAGGVLSDRKSEPDYLYGIILLAGGLTLLVPSLRGPVLKACMSLGLRLGAFTSSAILFGPSLFLLGCVSPYIVKIAAREMKNIGRTVGIFYALSTAGSFIGTVLTGFVLIAYFRVGRIFEFIGIALILLSVIYFVFLRRKWYFLAALCFPLFLTFDPGNVQRTMPDGTTAMRVTSIDSFYGNLKVVDYSYGDKATRELLIDGFVQGGIDRKSGMSVYAYPYFMKFLPYGTNPSGKDCLVIGLGAGIIPMWYEQRNIRTEVVDIDPKVVDVAQEYFGFKIKGNVVISDARYYLEVSKKKFDFIILDVFNGDTTPGYLLSLEAFRLLRKGMTDRGIVAFNLISSGRDQPFMLASVIKTLKEVFSIVRIYPSGPDEAGCRNIAILAYNDSSLSFNPDLVKDFPVHPFASDIVRTFMGREITVPENTPAIILSDDYNPIDFFDLKMKEAVRENIIKTSDWDVLI